jgi:hypothetical protein
LVLELETLLIAEEDPVKSLTLSLVLAMLEAKSSVDKLSIL